MNVPPLRVVAHCKRAQQVRANKATKDDHRMGEVAALAAFFAGPESSAHPRSGPRSRGLAGRDHLTLN